MGLLTKEAAKDLAAQIVNRYRVAHNLPAIGVGIVLPSTPQRILNKQKQTNFRAKHQRYSVWKNQYNTAIVTLYQNKLTALRVAKKAYDLANSALNILIKNNSNPANIAAASVVRNEKHAIFTAAQSISYRGDGTTL